MTDTAPTSDRVMTQLELAKAVGIAHSTLTAMRKAGKILGDPLPNFSTPSDVHAWLRRWPQFTAKDWEGQRWQERLEKYNAADRREQLVSRFGAK